MKKTIAICATIVFLAGIGAWVYVQQQNIVQRDREAHIKLQINDKNADESMKKLKYQECEKSNREALSRPILGKIGPFTENCDLIL